MDTNIKTDKIEKIIGIVMRIGVFCAISIMLFGVAVLLFNPCDYNYPDNISLLLLFNSVLELNPYSIMLIGVFILILTPVIRVITCIILFIIKKDRLYVLITLLVMIVLVASFILGYNLK